MRSSTVALSRNQWVELTNADAVSITFQNISSHFIRVKGTQGASAPGSLDGAFRYNPGQGELNTPLGDLFPGISGVNRVWAYATAPVQVVVQHA